MASYGRAGGGVSRMCPWFSCSAVIRSSLKPIAPPDDASMYLISSSLICSNSASFKISRAFGPCALLTALAPFGV
jgi:hypothetical protein